MKIVVPIIAVIFGLIMWLIVMSDASFQKKKWDHNDKQVAECKALGGFAQLEMDGWLKACTFPARVK